MLMMVLVLNLRENEKKSRLFPITTQKKGYNIFDTEIPFIYNIGFMCLNQEKILTIF